MLSRLDLLFVFSFALNAQQYSINFEISSTDFPETCVFKAELKPSFFILDVQKMASERRSVPSKKDYLFEQVSSNTYNWNISYNENKSPIIKASPQSVIFNFPKPLNMLSNAIAYIKLNGKVTLSNGKTVDVVPLGYTRQFRSGVSYVFRLEYKETKNGKILFGASFLTSDELKTMLENKPETDRFSGTIRITDPGK